MRFGAVLSDVGGVLLVAHEEPVTKALAAADVRLAADDFRAAHFRGVAAVDLGEGPGEDKLRYLSGYVEALGIAQCDRPRATRALVDLWGAPSIDLWREVLEESVRGLRLMAERNIPVAIVSNSDGTVEEQLRRNRICQVGVGLGAPVLAIIGSAVVGFAKPDTRAFAPAIAAIGLPPKEVAYVGDSVRYDMLGAERAGLAPIHFDPLQLCRSNHPHHHIQTMADLLE